MKVVVTGARAPAALHLARLFNAAGHAVVLADTFAYPLARATRCKLAYIRLPAPAAGLAAYAEAWRALIARHAPDLVVPTCEEVFHLAAVRDVAGVALPLFAPSLGLLTSVHDKHAFARLAHGFGADPPPTRLLTSADDVAAMRGAARDHVFKPVWSRFASRVMIRPTETRLAMLRPTSEDPWVAQAYLPGEEICAHAAAIDGEVTALQAYRPLYRAGPGAGVAFARAEDDAIAVFVRGLAKALCWTGHISFDFKRDVDGHPRVLECNPRPTSGVHFFKREDGLAEAILGALASCPARAAPFTHGGFGRDLPSPLAGEGARRADEGSLARWRHAEHERPESSDPSSGASRHLLPQGEKGALGSTCANAVSARGRGNTGEIVHSSETRIMGLPLAMAIYGGLDAFRGGRLRRWATDFRRMGDIAAWPGEGSLLPAQLLALAEIAGIALARRKSLQAASTDDVEWNGRPFVVRWSGVTAP